jgi:uncharacterized lipoprotein YmbA
MSQQVAANSQKLYTQTRPQFVQNLSISNPYAAPVPITITSYSNAYDVTLVVQQAEGTSTVPSLVMTVDGVLDPSVRPARDQLMSSVLKQAGNTVVGYVTVLASGNIVFSFPSGTSSGTCGVRAQTIKYSLL